MGRTRAAIGLAVVGIAVVALIVALAGTRGDGAGRVSGPFAWLRPAPPPGGWNIVRIPNGAALAYPPGWTAVQTDAGTASVALRRSDGEIDDYLNVTPKQGTETLANWSRFRPAKNREEGARNVRLLATIRNARFRAGRGSCVIDAYTTSVTTYQEVACLVAGAGSASVVVAATPARLWRKRAPVLERAVSSFAA